MKKNILITLAILLVIITLCGFVISYNALLTTAIDSGIDATWYIVSTKYIWPLTVDFALLTFEIALFYVTIYQPDLKRLLTSLVLSFVCLTIYFNVIHGLPTTWPVSSSDWMKASESILAWILPPLVQCLGVLTLAKIFSSVIREPEVSGAGEVVPLEDDVVPLEDDVIDFGTPLFPVNTVAESKRILNNEIVYD